MTGGFWVMWLLDFAYLNGDLPPVRLIGFSDG